MKIGLHIRGLFLDADFTRTRDVEPWPNELHSLAEQEIKSKAKNNNNSTIIATTATDGIEFIPVHEKDPADNIHSTPIIEHNHADDILVHPIYEQNPSDNILSTPIPDPQLPDVCGIPILEPGCIDNIIEQRTTDPKNKKEPAPTQKEQDKSAYKDATEPRSRYAKTETDITRDEFEKNLLKDGWAKSVSKDGKVVIHEKNGARYVIRDNAKSTGGPTADYYKAGSEVINSKIRLGDV